MFNGIIYEMCALVINQHKWTTKVSKDELIKERSYYCHHISLESLSFYLFGSVLHNH
jgi:hypothetical protein